MVEKKEKKIFTLKTFKSFFNLLAYTVYTIPWFNISIRKLAISKCQLYFVPNRVPAKQTRDSWRKQSQIGTRIEWKLMTLLLRSTCNYTNKLGGKSSYVSRKYKSAICTFIAKDRLVKDGNVYKLKKNTTNLEAVMKAMVDAGMAEKQELLLDMHAPGINDKGIFAGSKKTPEQIAKEKQYAERKKKYWGILQCFWPEEDPAAVPARTIADDEALAALPWPKGDGLKVNAQFKDQPCAGMGTGFSIGDGLVVTAGHCMDLPFQNYYAVFGFTKNIASTFIPADKVFEINRRV
jgi:hypothetical protein